jgi:hypothetical protein
MLLMLTTGLGEAWDKVVSDQSFHPSLPANQQTFSEHQQQCRGRRQTLRTSYKLPGVSKLWELHQQVQQAHSISSGQSW